ncbi:putative peroxin 14 17 protein [Phaeoacremonium minimum UCRPA7]|uniref:Peroxisomal membrane protein PEX14 n=1 Tax=Phaeoacremonium minimum (strain UCR-PA7) TaxID=1286976 RepID=R8BLY8_PHAM7|nr:putative peroxin 14 17 protein [Phaeoacremonium minimum UCRPA7]EOO00391.1 putative peroxin 14 17 protein [Phaeoacremonium minimum UCRPA7]
MGDSDDKAPGPPAWQQADVAQKPIPPADEGKPTIEHARKFLEDDSVREASREKKVEFLKSKGFSDDVIEQLLEEESISTPAQAQSLAEPARDESSLPSPSAPIVSDQKTDHAPIVTYPEFLTKPNKPPPLITANGLFNVLYAVTGLSTLVYGTTKYVVSPMVDSLTEARIDFHENALQNLKKLNEKLESTVSEIPVTKKAEVHAFEDDTSSSYDDPTELFHRDIGVQTSLPPTPTDTEPQTPAAQSTVVKQASRIAELTASIRSINEDLTSEAEDFSNIKTILDTFNEDLDKLTYPWQPSTDFVGSYSYYGASRGNEPDDEIKKAKENIRRLKGVFLSARSFPGSAR